MLSDIPSEMDPNIPLQVSVSINPREDILVNSSVYLHYRTASFGNWVVQEMNTNGLNQWNGAVPGMDCNDAPEFYISCEGEVSGAVELPSGASDGNAYKWMIGSLTISFDDNGESNGDWIVTGSAVDGQWNRGVPINCDRGDPNSDYDGSGSCWLTDNSSSNGCNSDVDEGSTTLTSGIIDLTSINDPILSYARWFNNSAGDSPNTDTFVVEWSSQTTPWTLLESVGPSGADVNGGWVQTAFNINDFAPGINQIQLRFTVSDEGADTQSVVEAGVDAIVVSATECDDAAPCPADTNDDGVVNVEDLLLIIDNWGQSGGTGDLNDDSIVNVSDLLMMIESWGNCP
jgi:hypothetical protein